MKCKFSILVRRMLAHLLGKWEMFDLNFSLLLPRKTPSNNSLWSGKRWPKFGGGFQTMAYAILIFSANHLSEWKLLTSLQTRTSFHFSTMWESKERRGKLKVPVFSLEIGVENFHNNNTLLLITDNAFQVWSRDSWKIIFFLKLWNRKIVLNKQTPP